MFAGKHDEDLSSVLPAARCSQAAKLREWGGAEIEFWKETIFISNEPFYLNGRFIFERRFPAFMFM
jgi:hypothetical protein